MAVDQKVYDPTTALIEPVGNELETALTNQGISSPETRIWQPSIPEDADIGHPRMALDVSQQRAPAFSNKESRSVRIDVDVRVYHTDMKVLNEIKQRVIERLTDRQNFPSISGWNVPWQDLQNDLPQHERQQNNPDIYGRIVTVEYYMNQV